MSEIKINFTNLRNCIQRFQKLAQTWEEEYTSPPLTAVATGNAADEIDELATLYKQINDQMVQLAEKTADFLNIVSISYQSSDLEAYKHLKGIDR